MKKEQQRVYKWLNDDLNLPVFADAYRGAQILLSQKSPGHISFIAHVGRDFMNFLASTVKGIQSRRVQYHNHLDEIEKDWRDEWHIEYTNLKNNLFAHRFSDIIKHWTIHGNINEALEILKRLIYFQEDPKFKKKA